MSDPRLHTEQFIKETQDSLHREIIKYGGRADFNAPMAFKDLLYRVMMLEKMMAEHTRLTNKCPHTEL